MGNERNESDGFGDGNHGIVPDETVEIDGYTFESNPVDGWKDWLAPPISGIGFFYFCPTRFNAWLKWQGYGQEGRQGIPPVLPPYATGPSDAAWAAAKRACMRVWTYFAIGDHTGAIKIGKSKQPEFRVSTLHYGGRGESAEMMVYVRGDREKAYHNLFKEWSIGNEWFAPHPDLLAEIERLKACTITTPTPTP